MKKILIILILANLGFFTAMQMRADSPAKEGNEPISLNENKIKLVDGTQTESKPAQEKEVAVLQVKQETAVENKAINTPPATAHVKPETPLCLEWGDFSGSELLRAKKVIAGLKLGEKLSLRETEYDKSYWVYMPPLKDRRAVIRKVREIKKLGINEYYAVAPTDKKWANAISLGVFKTQEAAEKQLKQLQTKGIRTAIVGERGAKLKTTWFVLSGINSDIKANLQQMQKDYPDSELQNAACALTKK
jgi:hypothetical protein